MVTRQGKAAIDRGRRWRGAVRWVAAVVSILVLVVLGALYLLADRPADGIPRAPGVFDPLEPGGQGKLLLASGSRCDLHHT